jgi:indole-3-glycerol phosphate synthase
VAYAAPRGAAVVSALKTAGVRVIAECKRRSPSRGILRHDYDPAAVARGYEAAGAAAISVLTEPTFFDGSLDHLRQVRAAVGLPLLRKDFLVTPFQISEARAAGADAVLLIVAALDVAELGRLVGLAADLGLAALVEVHDEDDVRRAIDAGAAVIGVNSRDLRSLDVRLGTFDRLAPLLPRGVVAVAESGLRRPSEIERLRAIRYDAFLIGERFIADPDPGQALRALLQSTMDDTL